MLTNIVLANIEKKYFPNWGVPGPTAGRTLPGVEMKSGKPNIVSVDILTSAHYWVTRQSPMLDLVEKNFFIRRSVSWMKKTLPKAHRTRGLSPSCQSNFLRSYHKFKHKSWAHFIFRIPSKHQLKISTKHQHLHILTKPSFGISTKTQLHNLYKTLAAKCWTNSSFKILPERQFQTLVLKVWTKI